MPDPAVLITALVLERPMCLACVAAHATVTEEQVAAALKAVGRVLVLTCESGSCAACGAGAPAYTVTRPPFSRGASAAC